MKRIRGVSGWASAAIVAAGFLGAGHAQAQEKDHLFDGVEMFSKGSSDATDVTLDKSMMGMAAGMGGKFASLAGKMDFVSVHSYEYPRPGMYNMADVERFSKRLDEGGWHHIVREHSGTEDTDICIKQDAEGQPTEMVVLDAEPTELDFIHLKGHLSLADLKKFTGGSDTADPRLSKRPQ